MSNALLDGSQAKISLYDRTDTISNGLQVSVEQQPARASGQACDSAAKSDRCQDGFGCSSSIYTCANYNGPSLTRKLPARSLSLASAVNRS